jgi:hypothetical protein
MPDGRIQFTKGSEVYNIDPITEEQRDTETVAQK